MRAIRERLGRILLDPRVALWAPPIVAAIAALQMLHQTRRNPLPGGHTHYNNFIIFRQAYVHLVEGRDLYAYFPGEYFDNFLYTPTFAALMAPLSWPPTWLGLLLWDVLNAAVLVLGIRAVPGLSSRSRALFVWFVLPEFIGSAQHSQTNPMIVGLLLLSLWAAEREKDWLAPLFLVLAGYVKIFPIAAGLFLLAYPGRVRLVLWCGAWAVVLGAVPLLLVSPAELAWQYGNWFRLHTTNPQHAAGVGITTEGILYTWFGLAPPRAAVVATGAVLTALPLVRVRDFGRFEFRAAFLGLLLMWMIAFNHLSESPTFVIAMSGIALWYFTQRSTPLHRALLWIAFVLVSLAYSDLSPTAFRKGVADAYALKGAPVLLTWMVAVAELTLGRGPGPRPASS